MSNRKKKKKQPCHPISKDLEVTKSYFDKFSEVARKTLQLIDLDPALYDKFSKKQKLEMMRAKFTSPHFEAKDGHEVPRHYIHIIQKKSMEFLQSMNIGDPALGLSYYDYFIMGSQFGAYIDMTYREKQDCEQAEVYKEIAEHVRQYEDFSDKSLIMPYLTYLRHLLGHLSQFNYRMYGFDLQYKEIKNRLRIAAHIQITAIECEKKIFIFKDKKRPAFRLIMANFMSSKAIYIHIPHNKVYKDSTSDKLLSVYIQSHALLRMKERLDTINVYERNIYVTSSVILSNVIKLETGRNAFELRESNNNIIGYLPFFIQDDCVIILTVLPVTNPVTPIGKKFCESLGASKAELAICGMDKLSYFLHTDFYKIPKLKQALEANNLMYLTEIQSIFEPLENIERSSGISATMFQTERTHEEILNEIEQKY